VASNPLTGDRQGITQGAVLFRQECVFCHGVSARGGMRGPDLTTGSWSHGGSDAELAATISAGVPGTAMPPNRLTEQEIWEIIAYLRTLQQPPAASSGDARRGETLFFGATRCSSCHIVNGRGGRLGPELSAVGSARSRAYIVESIREPGRRLTENRSLGSDSTLKFDTVSLVTADGATIVGVPLDEDTFTVQVMDAGERIHSFDKKALKSFRHEDRSLMPAYDVNRLNDSDLDDLVAFLQSLRAGSPAKKGGSHDDR
jgi:putative heme-binding domain-containing protein